MNNTEQTENDESQTTHLRNPQTPPAHDFLMGYPFEGGFLEIFPDGKGEN